MSPPRKKIPAPVPLTPGSAGQPPAKPNKRTRKRRPPKRPGRRGTGAPVQVRGTPEWADWVRDLAGPDGTTALVCRLLDAYAHQVGAPPAPPRALAAPQRPPPDRDGSGQAPEP